VLTALPKTVVVDSKTLGYVRPSRSTSATKWAEMKRAFESVFFRGLLEIA
jgi:hypothetical protein